MKKIAIIGSGITGISVAFHHPPNVQITMFDKSRRAGGRVCTRTSREHPGYSFDHGTPFIYPKNQFLNLLHKINAIKQVTLKCASFQGKQGTKTFEKKWVGGNPQIQTIPKKLLDEIASKNKIKFQFSTRIASISQSKQNSKLLLTSEENKQFGPYNQVYVCIPYPQSKTLKQNLVQFPKQQNTQHYLCSWVIMVAVDKNSLLSQKFKDLDVVTKVGENIQYAVNQRTKGKTSDDDLWVFTMDEKWCQQNMNLKPQNVEQQFKKKLSKLIQKQIDYKFVKAHRWLYSKPNQTPQKPIVGKNLIFGSDWVGKRTDVQGCWELGPHLVKIMSENESKL